MNTLATRAFIGRLDELAALDEALESASAGRPTTVLIGGDAGVGKSSLLARWNEGARERGARLVIGFALDLGELAPPYGAVTQALRNLLGAVDPAELDEFVGRDRSVLGRLIPELATIGAPGESWQLGQFRVFDRLRDILERASLDAPLVLELEDLHWADPSTRAFLVYLAENLSAGHLLTIGTYRPEDVATGAGFGSTLGQLRRRPNVHLVELHPFTRTEIEDQLEAVLGHAPTTALLEAVVKRSEGNALVVEELAAAADPTTTLPESVADATASRAASLSDDAQAVLRAAAVIGAVVDDDVLRSVAKVDDLELDRALRQIVSVRLLVRDPASSVFRFRHALIQEAIYDQTLPGERRRLHAAVATALVRDRDDEALDGTLAALVARHWSEAQLFEKAFRASLVAGVATKQQAAYEESVGHYERALELWDRAPEARTNVAHAAVLADAAASAYMAGAFAAAHRYARAAVDELGDAPDPSLQFRALVQLETATYGVGGDWFAIAAEVGRLEDEGRPPVERIRILEDRAYALNEENWQAAIALARDVQALSTAEGDPYLIARAEMLLSDCLWMRDPTASEALMRHALELVIDRGDALMENDVRRGLVETLQIAHKYEAIIEASEQGIEFAERRHLARMARARFCAHKAWAELRLGRLVEARSTVERGLADEPVSHVLNLLHLVGTQAATALGDYGDAAAHIEAGRILDAYHDAEVGRPYFGTTRAELALAERRLPDVRRFVEPALAHLAEKGPVGDELETAWWLAELGLAAAAEQAEIARAAGDEPGVEDARRFATHVTDLLERVRQLRDEQAIPDIGTVAGYEKLMAGHAVRLDGRDDPGLWAAAAEAFWPTSVEALGARVHQAEAMLATRAPKDEVQAVLAPAHATAVVIAARPLADRMAALARRARIDLRSPAAKDDGAVEAGSPEGEIDEAAAAVAALRGRGLTDREIEVLTLVAAGYSNGEIADRLFISAKTASVHVSHILDKLGVSTRTQAATIGVRLGLPDVEDAATDSR
jgi:DNA-binding CsgD family transcriptional regulator/tetratricopeptide (TPR) repeat protein